MRNAHYCSICGGPGGYFGRKDFNSTCEDGKGGRVFPESPWCLEYYLCQWCGFVWTEGFDGWSQSDFSLRLYNSEYYRADPEMDGTRTKRCALWFHELTNRDKDAARILDYGAGTGGFVEELKRLGYADVVGYDPFFKNEPMPAPSFDYVTAFEVVEHIPHDKQHEFFYDIKRLMSKSEHAIALVSTDLRKDTDGIDWHYVAPRNGHISLHSRDSLRTAAHKAGLRLLSLSSMIHVFNVA